MRQAQINRQSLLMFAVGCFLIAPIHAFAAAKAKIELEDGAKKYPPNNENVCVLMGPPPASLDYEVLGRIVATKRTYGSVDELFEPMIREARMIGADAIVNLQASQRFKGPLPWRITSPTGDGQAIKVLPSAQALDCLRVGGRLWGPGGPVLSSPSQHNASQASEDAPKSDESSSGTDSSLSKASAGSPPKVDVYKELLKLDDLRQRGILTEAEFQAEKKKLLDRN